MDGEKTRLIPKAKERWPQSIPARHLFILMGFLGFVNVYALRVNLSVALVSMVNATLDNRTLSDDCPNENINNTLMGQSQNSEFNWDSRLQGIILGSFFYGYVVTQLPGGRLAEAFGGRWVYGLGIFITGILTLLTPVMSRLDVSALIVLRVLEGLCEGVTFPSMHALLARWIPKTERSLAAAIIYSGSQVGAVISSLVSGILCDSEFFGGWPSVFYVFGVIACLWFPFWLYLVYSSPEEHPRISEEEKLYIKLNLGNEKPQNRKEMPWKSILTSVPVWALIICNFSENFGFYILLTELPTYLNTILHFDIANNGFVSSLPYLMQAIFKWIAGYIADVIYTKQFATPNTIRKICVAIADLGPALCLIAVALAGCDKTLNVVFFALALGINGFNSAGLAVTHIDMSPEYAGTLQGMTNTVGAIPGFVAPTIVGLMTHNQQTLKTWSFIYFLAACVYISNIVIFSLLGSARLQPWSFGIQHKNSINRIESSDKIVYSKITDNIE